MPKKFVIYVMLDRYLVVGTRSVEDWERRMLASEDTILVGLKNPTGGSKIALNNSTKASWISCKHLCLSDYLMCVKMIELL